LSFEFDIWLGSSGRNGDCIDIMCVCT